MRIFADGLSGGIMALDWNETMNDFTRYLTLERNLSDNTVQSYIHDIASFSEFVTAEFPHNSTPDEITELHIEQFLCNIYDNGLKATSQARIISGLKSFFKFLLIKGRIQVLPTEYISRPKQERNLPKVLSVEEVIAIIDAIDLSDPLGHRNRAIIELMYGCGLRVSEAITLKT
ncbi:MAG: site-specific integrase, partial [Rikenellaceae bacterium]|nr:site-specific integrase [Rikenellaceae bacterium]